MGTPPSDGPDLAGVIAAANHVSLPFVIIGGFAVIANQYIRGTEDVDLLIQEDRALDPILLEFLQTIDARRGDEPLTLHGLHGAETMRVGTCFGPVDLLREGDPPLDFQTVAEAAINLTFRGEPARVASLASLVAFKRLANRPRDQLDLLELERIHGSLPTQPVSGVEDL